MSERESWVGRRFAELSPEEQRALLEALGEPERDYHGFGVAGGPPRRDYEPIQPRGTDWRGLLRKLWAPLAALGAFLAKFGAVLLKFKFLFSMFVSAAVYVWPGGWWFGIGLVLLLFVHEMGHVLEAKRQGLPVSAPMFIPFLGAMITMREMPQDAWREARVGIAGPILGSLAAGAGDGVGGAYDPRALKAIAFP